VDSLQLSFLLILVFFTSYCYHGFNTGQSDADAAEEGDADAARNVVQFLWR